MECVSSLNEPSFTLLMACSLLNSFLQEAKNPNLVAVPGTQMWPGIWPSSQDPLFLARVLPAHTKCLLMHQTKRWLSSSSFPIMLLEHSYYDTLLGKPLKSQGSQLKPASKGPKKWQKLFSRSVQNWNINHKLILTSLQLFLFHVLSQSLSTNICFKITAMIIIQLIIQAFSYTSHTDSLIPWLYSFSTEIKKLHYITSLLIDTIVSFKIYYYKFTLYVL